MGKKHDRLDRKALRRYRRDRDRSGHTHCGIRCQFCYPSSDVEHRVWVLEMREGLEEMGEDMV